MEEKMTASAVRKKEYSLAFISPMLMHGLNNREEAEFRTSSLKGIMRYWWRTLQLYKNEKDLLKEEVRLFGGTTENGRKSPLHIHLVRPILGKERINILPHRPSGDSRLAHNRKKKTVFSPGIKENETADIIIQTMKNNPAFDLYNRYMEYLFHLAGMGQRARRGFGAVQWTEHRWGSVKQFAESLRTVLDRIGVAGEYDWNMSGPCLLKKKTNVAASHPVLYTVYIGKPAESVSEILKRIGQASHVGNAEGSLGRAKNGRKASPLWCTVRKIGGQYYPVITEVRTGRKDDVAGTYEEDKKIFLEQLGVK